MGRHDCRVKKPDLTPLRVTALAMALGRARHPPPTPARPLWIRGAAEVKNEEMRVGGMGKRGRADKAGDAAGGVDAGTAFLSARPTDG